MAARERIFGYTEGIHMNEKSPLLPKCVHDRPGADGLPDPESDPIRPTLFQIFEKLE
jgi:hypothetical protein